MSMKKLALATIATVFVASAYAAQPAPAQDQISAEMMTAEECAAAIAKCGSDKACVDALAAKGCKPEAKS